MPLLTIEDMEHACSLFKGTAGNAFGHFLMKLLSVDKLNDLYDRNAASLGPDFARAVLEDIGVRYEVLNREILSRLPAGPFITVSNHPYGSLDGLMLVDLFGSIRRDFKVIVNSILARIKALDENLICVTPTGTERTAPTADSVRGIKNAVKHIRSGHPLGIFPSGAVSDLSLRDRRIRDREWQEPVIRMIKILNVPVVPVHFLDRNSNFYYSLGLIDWRVRLARLPAEVFNKRGKQTRIALGEIIMPERLSSFEDQGELRSFLRNMVYNQY